MTTIAVRLESELDAFMTTYQTLHKIKTRAEVIRRALRTLQNLERQQALRTGYQHMVEDFARESDPWLDSGLQEILEFYK